jgi:hypothetical protein
VDTQPSFIDAGIVSSQALYVLFGSPVAIGIEPLANGVISVFGGRRTWGFGQLITLRARRHLWNADDGILGFVGMADRER